MQLSSKLQLRLLATSSLALLAGSPVVFAQGSRTASALLSGPIDTAHFVRVPGNVRSAARVAGNDRGPVDGSMALNHMLLQLQRSPEREAALDSYLAELNDSASPNYHRWLTAAQLGEQFGPAASDIAAVQTWLTGQGFTVDSVAQNGLTIEFSGTADQVGQAFHTAIHRLSVAGETHIANTEDPAIPTALAGVVAGVVSLNDFRPHQLHRNISPTHFDTRTGSQTTEGTTTAAKGTVRPDYTYTSGSSTYQAVVPGDLATIYNLKPLFAAGYSGQGQTIAVIEDTDVYTTADWTKFRSTFGLSSYTSGTFTQEHPGGGKDAGVNGADGEAILDAEW